MDGWGGDSLTRGGGGSRPQLVDHYWDLTLMIITITNYVISIVP